MSYLLDSDILIDFLQKKNPGFTLISKVSDEELFISVITWIEVVYGIKKGNLSASRLTQLVQFLQDANIEVIPIDLDIGIEFVELKVKLEDQGQKLADFDLLIAGTAKKYQLTLLTRNTKHFERIPRLKIFKT